MTNTPIAQLIHPGGSIPDVDKQQTLGAWLTANGINANLVAAGDPITVLSIPVDPQDADDDGPWMAQVIVFSQFYMREDGTKDSNLLTRMPVTFQRTVPLRVAFPTAPEKDKEEVPQPGEDRSQAEEDVTT